MNKWWLIAGAAVIAAYAFGRYDESQRRSPPSDAPIPPIPQPQPDAFAPSPQQLPPSYADEWEEASARYDIDFYPPEAEPHLARLLPPPSIEGVSIAPGCQAIAVGEGWWYAVHQRASEYVERGQSVGQAIENTLKDYFPSCLGRNTNAVIGLRREMKQWLEQQPTRNSAEPLLTRS